MILVILVINLQELSDLTTAHELVELQVHVTNFGVNKYQYSYESEHEKVSLYTSSNRVHLIDDGQNAQARLFLCRNTLKIDSRFLAVSCMSPLVS